jgi:hypothetical protein
VHRELSSTRMHVVLMQATTMNELGCRSQGWSLVRETWFDQPPTHRVRQAHTCVPRSQLKIEFVILLQSDAPLSEWQWIHRAKKH